MRKIVVVQCRLGSHRLSQKALKKLDERCVLEFVLSSMGKVSADDYYVLTDFDSATPLEPIVKNAGWKIFAGSEFDVLDRFCSFLRYIENTDIYHFPDYIVRATADNPFLFYDAANEMCARYEKLQLDKTQSEKIDYFTWTGLPHGSGVEILNVKSLLDSIKYTANPYDHEHVGPALYNHSERYNCVFEMAPEKYNYPEIRTTIDTFEDYFYAKSVVVAAKTDFVAKADVAAKTDAVAKKIGTLSLPLETEKIIQYRTSKNVTYPILFVPTCKKEHGTGHFRRCLELASRCTGHLYIENDENSVLNELLNEKLSSNSIMQEQIVRGDIPKNYYKIIVLDSFCTKKEKMDYFASFAPIVTLDDGASYKILQKSSYNLNIIPSDIKEKNMNFSCPDFIPLPTSHKTDKPKSFAEIKKALIVFGGNGNQKYSNKVAVCLKEISAFQNDFNCNVTIINNNVKNLSDTLYLYDLVITHYGFTAFEAASANCLVLTIPPTSLHKKLSEKTGFESIDYKNLTPTNLKNAIEHLLKTENDNDFIAQLKENNRNKNDAYASLSSFMRELSQKDFFRCPNCKKEGNYDSDIVVSRDKIKTIRKCNSCSLEYISFLNKEKTLYTSDYFAQEYKNQYGKTYLDDFDSIKQSGFKRHSLVEKYLKTEISQGSAKKSTAQRRLLDVGCAYGPYLSAASENEAHENAARENAARENATRDKSAARENWDCVGLDICEPAVNYVKQELGFKAFVGNFQDQFSQDFKDEIVQNGKFDAVTMWYVIEHFQNLDEVLQKVSSVLKKGGVFAFSTPSASGVSAKKNTKNFYLSSPSDHYSIWKPKNTKKILANYGFKVKKIVYTGLHPERYPYAKKHNLKENDFLMKFFKLCIKIFHYGDTFEVYCVKEREEEIAK